MEIFAFLLIGGIWAAFLVPSFFESRRHGPVSTTRNFARSQDLLASVSGVNAPEVKARRKAASRRRRVLSALGAGALSSLVIAVWQNSFTWLAVTIALDLALAGYVTLLLQMRATRAQIAPVLSLVTVDPSEDVQHHTVRVVAG